MADSTPLGPDCGPHCGTDERGTRHCGHCHGVPECPPGVTVEELTELESASLEETWTEFLRGGEFD